MTPASKLPQSRGRIAALGALIFLCVLGVFLPALHNGFVNYDDPEYVTANPQVQGGLSWEGVRWAFRGGHSANWHPLTWLSHMADCQWYGLRPWGHHFTSVLLHATSALLLFLILRRMTGSTWRSLMVAALFGLHPLRVESVAWVSERKDVLSAFFWMLTLGSYARWAQYRKADPSSLREAAARSGDGFYYWLALVFLCLGLMCKAMLVTLPFVLLLLDYWPLGRLEANKRLGDKPLHLLIAEKIPFFIVVAVAGGITLVAQGQAGAVSDLTVLPLGSRIGNSLVTYCRYLGELILPVNLAVYYPYAALPVATVLFAGALVLGLSVLAVARRRKYPYLFVGWFWYIGTLVPVIGWVQVGSQAMADRYTYIPSIGIFLALVWGAHEAAARWQRRTAIAGVAGAAVLAGCALLTVRQISYWADSETLFRHALAVTENNWLAHNNLGNALADDGRRPEAMAQYGEALRLEPGYAKAHNNLGIALADADRGPEAVAQYEEALRLRPDFAEAHNNLGNALLESGKTVEAIDQYRETLRLNPDFPEALSNLAYALANSGQKGEAAGLYEKALRLRPRDVKAREGLGTVLAQMGRMPQAVEQFAEAARLRPDDAVIHNILGCALAELGRSGEARSEFEEVLRIKPGDAEARANLELLRNPGKSRN